MTARPDYVAWLADQQIPLFEASGVAWRRYRSVLVPADPTVAFVEAERSQVRNLLRQAKAPFARWSSSPRAEPTEWWHVVCSRYSHAELSANTRSKVNRGRSRNTVRSISPLWLAANGYECYAESFRRYGGARPIDEVAFRAELEAHSTAPLEIWGVFNEEKLGGYVRVVIGAGGAALTSMKLDPAVLPSYGAYALLSVMLEDIVGSRGLSIQNGSRAVAHETEMQDFLLKFGFERKYGCLEIVYSPLGQMVASVARWAAPIAGVVPRGIGTQMNALATQEKFRRKTAALSARGK